MNKFQELYRKISDTEKYKSEIQSAKEKFELKPFVEEWYMVKQLATILHPTLSLFSITTGFGFLFYQFAGNLNVYVSVVLVVVLLVLLELFKSKISALTFQRFYIWGNHSLNYGLLFFSLACFALSVFLSINGAMEIYRHLDKSETDLQLLTRNKMDSLLNGFDKRIFIEKKSLDSFRESVSWQGKINVSDKTVSATLHSHTAKIDSLEKDKRQALLIFQAQANKQMIQLESNNGFNLAFWFWLSLLVEGLIIFSLYFIVWYDYKVSQESELFEQSVPIELNLPSIQNLIRFAGLYQSPELLNTGISANHKTLANSSLSNLNEIQGNPRSGNYFCPR